MTWSELLAAIAVIPASQRNQPAYVLDRFSGVVLAVRGVEKSEAPLAIDAGFTARPSDPPREVVAAGGFYVSAE